MAGSSRATHADEMSAVNGFETLLSRPCRRRALFRWPPNVHSARQPSSLPTPSNDSTGDRGEKPPETNLQSFAVPTSVLQGFLAARICTCTRLLGRIAADDRETDWRQTVAAPADRYVTASKRDEWSKDIH